ncbi:glycosyltransferase [Nocardiopsis lambiniae]|uniref:4,4'-diaponeurosporenoate glycosyltransferase n=1 Tax=Nocardiopsis lambiniae TaxID=3075539 RepID=A0ABU2M4D1_9ACTN|nr:glycosyltransferase [Nocardiopsis sp. DSM 44743]MDT0327503.1 glycosyltransferase [Nocardiopsis sp. DSM 44743]
MIDFVDQPRIRRNQYDPLDPPTPGEWTPSLSVSVIVPAHGQAEKLALVLASLAGQSYPSHLTEVIVVDDGSPEPLVLPPVRPENTLIIPSAAGAWGSGHAVNTGVAAASGQVILRLDADMLVYREHVESQLRWHHLVDYAVVLGHKLFVDFDPARVAGDLSPERVLEEVRAGRAGGLFDRETAEPHWIEDPIERSDGLRTAGFGAFKMYVGATGSCHRALFEAAGGMDPDLILGGDSEFGHRLAQQGAVFVPDDASDSWHLGRSQMQDRRETGMRLRAPYVANRVPDFHLRAKGPDRIWEVPRVEVVLDVAGRSLEDVDATVAMLLAGTAPDVRVWLVGPWGELSEGRRAPLEEELLDLRLIRETYRGDLRVQYGEEVPEADPRVPFRLLMPTGVRPLPDMISALVRLADRKSAGLVCAPVPGALRAGDGVLRLERFAAFSRARHLSPKAEGTGLDRVVEEVGGLQWTSAQRFVEPPEGAEAIWGAPRPDATAPAPEPTPVELRAELRRARTEIDRLRRRAERTERKLRWFTPGLGRRLLRRIAR